jgi:hypothetical protein
MASEPVTRDIPSPRYPGTALRLEIHVVDDLLVDSTYYCVNCAEALRRVQCNAWVTFENGTQEVVECCAACLIGVLDATPYLDDTQTITVEVIRGATLRPF